jgi:hypothetical protein
MKTKNFPQSSFAAENSFSEMQTLNGAIVGEEVTSVEYMDGRFWLVIGLHDFLIPLLCPVCHHPMHFTGNPKQILKSLTKGLTGFIIAGIRFHPIVMSDVVDEVLKRMYSDSDAYGPLMNSASHMDASVFPVIFLEVGKISPPESLDLTGTEAEVRERYELLGPDFKKEVEELKKFWVSEDNYDVDDDMMIPISPLAFLEIIIPAPSEAEGAHLQIRNEGR